MSITTRQLVSSVFLLLTTSVITHAQAPLQTMRNEIEVRGIVAIPSGEASFSSNGNTGSVISFSDDFDFKNEIGFMARYTHWSTNGKHKISGEYSQTSWDRQRSLSRSFTFRGQTFQANLDTSAQLRLNDFKVMYAYRWGNEKVKIGPMVDMGVINTRLEISGTTNNGTRTEEGNITKFAATVGYDLEYMPSPNVYIFNNLGAIAFQGERLFHVEGGVKGFFTNHFGASGGYKYQRYRVEKSDDFLKINNHGPFFGGVVRF
jgi:hypothetical protein